MEYLVLLSVKVVIDHEEVVLGVDMFINYFVRVSDKSRPGFYSA